MNALRLLQMNGVAPVDYLKGKWSRLADVIERHPRYAGVFRTLLVSDQGFRHLCEDYLLLQDMIAELDAPSLQDVPDRRQEYAALLAELENDIARDLANASPVFKD